MGNLQILEWVAVGLNLLFIYFIIKENAIGWSFGILASIISIAIFFHSRYYSEAILYTYYVFVGVYGWATWTNSKNKLRITEWRGTYHLAAIVVGLICFLGLGYFFATKTNADKPFADAFSTIFSFIATYMEAKKILSAWLYWIILNAYSVWLYSVKGLDVYAVLMVVYAILSVSGYMQWKKSMKHQSIG